MYNLEDRDETMGMVGETKIEDVIMAEQNIKDATTTMYKIGLMIAKITITATEAEAANKETEIKMKNQSKSNQDFQMLQVCQKSRKMKSPRITKDKTSFKKT
jgi:hypothetical protein